MDEVATILNKLRAAAGFTEGETPQQSPAPLQSRPDPWALAQAERVTEWVETDPTRWKRVHEALVRMYTPVWERVDSRDILVAWVAACLARSRARQELDRLNGRRGPLTERERATRGGRQADVSFWDRLADWLYAQVPLALTQDTQAAEVLARLVKEGEAP